MPPIASARTAVHSRPRQSSSASTAARRRECLSARAVEVVEHPRFQEPDAEAFVATAERAAAAEREALGTRTERDEGRHLPAHLRALCRRPLFSPAEERAAFLRFNWERHRARDLHQRMLAMPARGGCCQHPANATARSRPTLAASATPNGPAAKRLLDELEAALARADAARNDIVLANTRLVVAVAKTFVGPGLSFDDLLAAGMPVLVRAVELFDVSRGYRFSTYGTWAVRNHFLRVRKRHQRHRERFRTGEAERLAEAEAAGAADDDSEAASNLARAAAAELLAGLDDRDRVILEARFGLNGRERDQTFAEIGPLVGLGKERVRQLTHRALAALREWTPEGPWSVGA